MLTLVLPRLVAGRDLADELVDRLADDLDGHIVVVDGRKLLSGTPSFASQLVHRLLAGTASSRLVLVGAPADFAGYVTESAAELGVAARLDLAADLPAAASG